MTNKIKEAIDNTISYLNRYTEDVVKQSIAIGKLEHRLLALQEQLSDEIDVNLYGGSYWITITNRDDLAPLLTLAPQWRKSEDSLGIDYQATVDGVDFHIKTREGALPPTCRVVEIEVDVPARKEKRRVVQCDQSVEEQVLNTVIDEQIEQAITEPQASSTT